MTEVTHTLCEELVSVMSRGSNIIDALKWTYKTPSKKTPLNSSLCLTETFNRHTIGSGRRRMKKSRIKLQIPFHLKNATMSTQCPAIVLSQFLAKGVQPRKARIVHAIQKPQTTKPVPQSATRKAFTTPKIR